MLVIVDDPVSSAPQSRATNSPASVSGSASDNMNGERRYPADDFKKAIWTVFTQLTASASHWSALLRLSLPAPASAKNKVFLASPLLVDCFRDFHAEVGCCITLVCTKEPLMTVGRTRLFKSLRHRFGAAKAPERDYINGRWRPAGANDVYNESLRSAGDGWITSGQGGLKSAACAAGSGWKQGNPDPVVTGGVVERWVVMQTLAPSPLTEWKV